MAAKVVAALQAWKYTCPTGLASSDPAGDKDSDATRVQESIGCTVFHAALHSLLLAAFGDEATAAGVGFPASARLNVLLTSFVEPAALKSNFWDDVATDGPVETKEEILLRAVIDAAAVLSAWKADENDWQWGRAHTLSLLSIYDSFGVAAFNDGPYANDGALYTVDVGNPQMVLSSSAPEPGELPMHHTTGASLRLVVEADDGGMTMRFQFPGGTSMDRESSRYNQLLERYLKNEPVDFAFGPGAVSSPAETLQVFPAE